MALKKSKSSRRAGKTQGVGELVNKLIDPALKKRGFASRDILENWHVIAPPPYNKVTIPDQLKWRRGEAGAQGAVLILRCHEGHRLALAHDHQRIASAINAYFGYVLVDAVKLSINPFTQGSQKEVHTKAEPNTIMRDKVDHALMNVENDDLKLALRKLGLGMMSKK